MTGNPGHAPAHDPASSVVDTQLAFLSQSWPHPEILSTLSLAMAGPDSSTQCLLRPLSHSFTCHSRAWGVASKREVSCLRSQN